jgi:serine/threonine protein phosphatase PrpC
MLSLLATSSRSPAARVPRSPSLRVETFGLSHPGLCRENNEDAFCVAPRLGLLAVADGVGGNAAGEVASRLAIDSVVTFFEDITDGRPGPTEPAETAWQATFAASLFTRAVEEANAVVHAAASTNRAMKGMASTFTGLLLLHDRAVIAHVGDTRDGPPSGKGGSM